MYYDSDVTSRSAVPVPTTAAATVGSHVAADDDVREHDPKTQIHNESDTLCIGYHLSGVSTASKDGMSLIDELDSIGQRLKS